MAEGLGSSAPRGDGPAYRVRFALAYAALALVAVAAVGSAYLLSDHPRTGSSAGGAWSAWQPEGEDLTTYPAQIADHVGGRYRLEDGQQLASVLAGPPIIQDVPVRAIAVRSSAGAAGQDLRVVPTDFTVMYTLCGLGASCTPANGQPSEARQLLARRAALELALYTFRYFEIIDSVVVLLPPARPDVSGLAVFFLRSDLEAELEQPLAETLADEVPGPGRLQGSAEGAAVDQLTLTRSFDWEVQQLQDGSITMQLVPTERGSETL